MSFKKAADTSVRGDGALPVRLSDCESGVSVVKCVVDYECYVISCGLLSAGLNRTALQKLPHL